MCSRLCNGIGSSMIFILSWARFRWVERISLLCYITFCPRDIVIVCHLIGVKDTNQCCERCWSRTVRRGVREHAFFTAFEAHTLSSRGVCLHSASREGTMHGWNSIGFLVLVLVFWALIIHELSRFRSPFRINGKTRKRLLLKPNYLSVN